MLTIDTRKMAALGAAGFIATALIFAATTPALGQPVTVTAQRESLTRVVPYGDLSLASQAGRDILMHRVGAAVDEVCPLQEVEGFTYAIGDCRAFAWTGARSQIRRALDDAQSNPTLAMSITVTSAI